MDLIIANSRIPFRWKGKEYKIIESGIRDKEAYATVKPENLKLEEELKRRITKDNGLKVYLGTNYICFTEDYPAQLY